MEAGRLRFKQGGLGLSRAGDLADVAYLCSRDAAFDDCVALDGNHVWDDGAVRPGSGDGPVTVIGEWLCGSVTRVNGRLPDSARFAFGARPGTAKQGLLMEVVRKKRRMRW